MRKAKILAASVTTALMLVATGHVHAEDYKVNGQLAIVGTGKSLELDKGHTAWHGETHATFFSSQGEDGMFDKVSTKCMDAGETDLNNKKVVGSGFCVQGNDEENQAWFKWSCEGVPGQPCTGKNEYIGGTGKYRGIRGTVTFVGHPIRNWGDGMTTRWSSWSGQVTIP
jgi:hypothetical protein